MSWFRACKPAVFASTRPQQFTDVGVCPVPEVIIQFAPAALLSLFPSASIFFANVPPEVVHREPPFRFVAETNAASSFHVNGAAAHLRSVRRG